MFHLWAIAHEPDWTLISEGNFREMQPGTGMKLFQSMVATISRSPKLFVHENDYEVIVVDNGSSPPVDRGLVQSYGKQFDS